MAKLSQPPRLDLKWRAAIGDHVIALAWSPDGSSIAAAAVSGPITLFDANGGAVKQSLRGHGFGTAAMSWHPDGKRLATCGQDGKVRIWDASSAQEIAALDAGAAWAERVVWSPKGNYLVAAAGKKLRLWDDKGELVRAYPDQAHSISDVIWGLKGKEIIAGGYGGVSFLQPDKDEPRTRFEWKGSVLALALSPDGKFLAGGSQNASVHFWYAKSGEDLEMSGYPLKVRELSWDSGSRFLATGGGHQVTVWDCSGKGPAGSTPLTFELHEEPIAALQFQRRGVILASGCAQGTIALWYPGGTSKVLANTNLGEGVSQLAWSPTDGRLAAGGEGGAVGVYGV